MTCISQFCPVTLSGSDVGGGQRSGGGISQGVSVFYKATASPYNSGTVSLHSSVAVLHECTVPEKHQLLQ